MVLRARSHQAAGPCYIPSPALWLLQWVSPLVKCCPQAHGMWDHGQGCGIHCQSQTSVHWAGESRAFQCLFDGSQIAQDTSSLLANEPCSRFMSWPLRKIPSSPEVCSFCDSTWELTCWSSCMQAKELHFSANRLLGQGLWKPKAATEPGRFFMDHSGPPITHYGSLSWSISLVCLRNAQILRALALDSHSLSAFASTAEAEKV